MSHAKSTKLGHRKGSGIAGSAECVEVGALVCGVLWPVFYLLDLDL